MRRLLCPLFSPGHYLYRVTFFSDLQSANASSVLCCKGVVGHQPEAPWQSCQVADEIIPFCVTWNVPNPRQGIGSSVIAEAFASPAKNWAVAFLSTFLGSNLIWTQKTPSLRREWR
jgi:hypothetical protein